MSNFNNLEHYIIPSDLLITMLNAYKEIGKSDEYIDKIASNKDVLIKSTLNKDAKALCELMNLKVSDNRLTVLLQKDVATHNKEEEAAKNIKEVLTLIQKDAQTYPISASELISYINKIFGKHQVNYTQKLVSKQIDKNNAKKTIRMLINECFDEHDSWSKQDLYEKNILMITLYLDIINLEPFNMYNDLAGLLLIYYLLFQNKIKVFQYQSFFELLLKYNDEFQKEVKNASINYSEGYIQSSNVSRIIFKMIIEAYNNLAKCSKEINYINQGLKSDNVERTIYQLPEFFTKEDVRAANPTVSDATIVRILNKMKDDGLIMPLGTGRSAKWRKNQENIDQIDLSKKLGD